MTAASCTRSDRFPIRASGAVAASNLAFISRFRPSIHFSTTLDLEPIRNPSERLRRLYEEPVVLLCGSTALAENMPWSDIDLIVIADFEKPFLDRLAELALLNDTGLTLEVLGYTPAEFMQMLDNLNPLAIEAVEFGIPILPGRLLSELKEKLTELKKLGLTKAPCTCLIAKRDKSMTTEDSDFFQ